MFISMYIFLRPKKTSINFCKFSWIFIYRFVNCLPIWLFMNFLNRQNFLPPLWLFMNFLLLLLLFLLYSRLLLNFIFKFKAGTKFINYKNRVLYELLFKWTIRLKKKKYMKNVSDLEVLIFFRASWPPGIHTSQQSLLEPAALILHYLDPQQTDLVSSIFLL